MTRKASLQHRNAPVDADDLVPFFHSQFVERNRRRALTGVVEEQIEPAELFDRLIEEGADGVGIGDVRGDGERACSQITRERSGLGECLGAAAGEGDGIAGSQQCEGDGAADARTGAGDDGDGGTHGGMQRREEQRIMKTDRLEAYPTSGGWGP
jgi:hypothetical protein